MVSKRPRKLTQRFSYDYHKFRQRFFKHTQGVLGGKSLYCTIVQSCCFQQLGTKVRHQSYSIVTEMPLKESYKLSTDLAYSLLDE